MRKEHMQTQFLNTNSTSTNVLKYLGMKPLRDVREDTYTLSQSNMHADGHRTHTAKAFFALMPSSVSTKSCRTPQCGVPSASHALLPFSWMMSFITLKACTKLRDTAAEEILSHTSFTPLHICSVDASVLFQIWSFSEWRLDIIGNTDRPRTLVYGP